MKCSKADAEQNDVKELHSELKYSHLEYSLLFGPVKSEMIGERSWMLNHNFDVNKGFITALLHFFIHIKSERKIHPLSHYYVKWLFLISSIE